MAKKWIGFRAGPPKIEKERYGNIMKTEEIRKGSNFGAVTEENEALINALLEIAAPLAEANELKRLEVEAINNLGGMVDERTRETKAKRDYIVRAVNSHDDMLSALKAMKAIKEGAALKSTSFKLEALIEIGKLLDAAIQKAGGQ